MVATPVVRSPRQSPSRLDPRSPDAAHHARAFPPPLPISGVVIARNEADRIERCVGSLRSVCAEVVVVDSGSTDDTVERAQALGARVVHQDWLGFGPQKNAAIAQANHPWVLLLDADEWLEPRSIARLRKLFAKRRVESADVWRLLRDTHFLGHRLRGSSFSHERVERLFRNRFRYRDAAVHERLQLDDARVRVCVAVIEHDTARSEFEYWNKLQRYAALWACEQHGLGRRASPARARLAPWFYCVKQLLLRQGILDGRAGWRMHRLHMRYVALKYRLLAEQD